MSNPDTRQNMTARFYTACAHFRIVGLLATSLLVSMTSMASADVRLPAVIDSHMVLQRDAPITIWGWADAGEKVRVTIDQTSAAVVAADNGKWQVTLPPRKADGKTHTVTITGNNTITLQDILIGEVWVGSGQSNMEWHLRRTQGPDEAIAAADFPNIRLFHVPKTQQPEAAEDVVADWKVCSPETIPEFSAVLYYYGRKLHQELNVPIGLINSSWGGSPIEPWTVTDGKGGGMYNGMIAPLTSFSIRGAIWYQGETNAIQKNGLAYFDRMQALIEGWRKEWHPQLPFYFVQIAPCSNHYEDGQLPALWEAQVQSLKIPDTGMAVITDLVDNIADIHPQNKLDVGNRLALWALNRTYGKDIVCSGPLFRTLTIEGNRARVAFAHDAGLQSRDGEPLSEFQIAGEDGSFVDATAVIDGSTVVVSAESVAAPKHVRFGWHRTANPNLVNEAGLPASPFQSNEWRGGTGE